MTTILIQNATIINEGIAQVADLRIRGAYIDAIAPILSPLPNDECIDATGQFLLPGLIDDQVHFREPGLTHKACIASESQAAVAGGITSFIEMPNTQPQTTTFEAYQDKLDRAAASAAANYSFMFGGTNDNLELLKKLDKTKVAAIKLFLGSSTGNMLVDDHEVLRQIFSNTDMVIAAHCEDEQTIRDNLAKHKAIYGAAIPIEKHPIIRSEAACYISSSQAIRLAEETGARLHVFHVSTAKETTLFRNDIPLKDKKITAEVCTHHLWFSEDDYAEKGTLIKWNPAVKKASDRKALWAALNDDRLDVLATDHAPHTWEEKQQPYTQAPSGGPLVQHALPALLTAVNKGKISLEKVVEKACHNPAILFDIEKRGFVKEGFFADLVLVDLNQSFEVKKKDLLYQCQWSPFEGTQFSGSVLTTFVNGKKVFNQGKIIEKHAGMQLTFTR
ncbi:MAG: dihydroorotase [Bacteroidetes bacterium]|nr:dihydroorotase [Bacteroidota bacterium]MDA0938046.1 dihydroorotase [Bacteroidota bacterium]MDA1343925.1 dihydroorotase [Bacteroidota bacterium]